MGIYNAENRTRLSLWRDITALTFCAVFLADAIIVAARWPFTEERITESLERATGSHVRIGGFRQTFLPFPGCIAENVVVLRGSVPLATIGTLSVESSWLARAKLSRRIRRIRAEALHVRIPAHTPEPVRRRSAGAPESTITELLADGAVVEFLRKDGKHPLRFEFPRLELHGVARQKKINFGITARQPLPRGNIRSTGTFGPWNSANPGETALSGSFDFADADLSSLGGVHGILFSSGTFSGALARIEVRGRAKTRDFGVASSVNRVGLLTPYSCAVNALTGDVVLRDVEAQFLRTTLKVRGRVAGVPGQRGKSAMLNFDSHQARMEDLLHLFTSSRRPTLTGPVTLTADVTAPPGDSPFLKKLRLHGSFRMRDARFATRRTQTRLDELSARARDQTGDEETAPHPAEALAHIRGSVALDVGIAKLSNISFTVPGATARGAGSYDLLTKRVKMSGVLSLDVGLSKMSSGWKAILLKPVELFLKRNKNGGSVVPVSITGTFSRPIVQLHLTGRPK